eukprot:CAMPEP_0176265822 /NCGR_PEP_ID=MMETSP0121_2-20121125/42337_1 /TAXON_ID=160619 /ORGANISM="Kryptoperidinium foliaceum, Strain CCMP 1326" /LENGTH=109 /DNA_ID=CAMNT_0017605857 /DNA_START=46 /DNA_END=371 /DNA_ORIENTATION=+
MRTRPLLSSAATMAKFAPGLASSCGGAADLPVLPVAPAVGPEHVVGLEGPRVRRARIDGLLPVGVHQQLEGLRAVRADLHGAEEEAALSVPIHLRGAEAVEAARDMQPE